tara:strand:- start:561 stop:731 length:171 start_codon:yes stop_codon:yes gene_type:complete
MYVVSDCGVFEKPQPTITKIGGEKTPLAFSVAWMLSNRVWVERLLYEIKKEKIKKT